MMPDARRNAVSNLSGASQDNLEDAMWQLKIEDGQEGADGQLSSYPDRPGMPDCLYYLRTGNCGYGNSCKYNHPTHTWQNNQFSAELPQRDGQPDCQFFLKTGTCKYGTSCKYHHPRDKHDTKLVQLNVLGLPIRKDEKPCAYYMRTGTCKYGVACKFNHPQSVTTGATFPPPAYGYSSPVVPTSASPVISGISPWSLSKVPYMSSPRMQALPAYVPLVLPTTQGTMAVQQGWNTYMRSSNAYQGSMNHIYPPNMLAPNQISNSMHQEQSGSSFPLELPERPDRPDCQYYMKTGSCKYGTSCKYHHPKENNQAAIAGLGPLGLPLRPGQPVCTFYTTYGSCKFGTDCKYDHPLISYYGYTLPSFSSTDPAIAFAQAKSSQIVWTAEKPFPKSSKTPDQFSKSETANGQYNLENHDHGSTSAHTTSNTEPSEDSP